MATTEVADILTIADCVKEANVYGVQVPGNIEIFSTFYISLVCLTVSTTNER